METLTEFYSQVKANLEKAMVGKNLKERRHIQKQIREVEKYISAQKELDKTVAALLKKGKFIDIRV